MTSREPSPADETRIDHIVDTRGISYSDARKLIMGREIVKAEGIQSRPQKSPKPGYVQDFSGRSDEHRGGPQLSGDWLSEEQKATNLTGIEAVRRVMAEVEPSHLSAEEEREAIRRAEVAKIKRKAAEPWV